MHILTHHTKKDGPGKREMRQRTCIIMGQHDSDLR